MGIRIDGSTDQISAADGSLTIEGQSINTTGIITAASFFVGSATTTASQGVNVGLGASVVSDAVNEISVYTGSVERVNINSSGSIAAGISTFRVLAGSDPKIGVGTFTPGYTIEAFGSSNPTVSIVDTTNAVTTQVRSNSTGGLIRTASNHPLVLGTNQAENLRITSAGLVGVGTDSISGNLEVYNGASKINVITLRTGAGASGYAGLAFASNQTKAREKAALYFQETNAGAHFTGDLVFAVNGTSGGAAQVSSADERLRITDEGKVGINTSTPKQELHVHDNTIYEGIFINGSAAPRVTFARGSTATVEWGVGVDGTDGSKFAIAQAGNTAKLLLTTGGNLSATGTITDSKGDVRNIPNSSKTGAYELVATDGGKAIHITTGGITVPNAVFAGGEAVTIVNASGSNQTITQATSLTMYNASDAATGNRTLAGRGVATIWFHNGSTAYISGAGLS